MRTLRAAAELFAEYGVGATSYQMIANAIGVTKGAIYHQFNTKDEIIIAVAEMELATLEDALEAAEALDCRIEARELLLNLVIDHAVEHRRAANTLQFDPVIVRLLSDHEPFQRFVERLYGMLVGDEPGPRHPGAARRPDLRRRRHGVSSAGRGPGRRHAAHRAVSDGAADCWPAGGGFAAPDGSKAETGFSLNPA